MRLHLVYPIGFAIQDKHLRRSGMDYWHDLDVHHHDDWEAFQESPAKPDRLMLFTTNAKKTYWDVEYKDGDGLLFGNEGFGAPDWLHDSVGEENRVTIPQYNETLRSLNLSTAAGIAVYEVMRQVRG